MYLPEVTITSDDLTLEINKDYEVYYSLAGETWKKPGANTTKALWALGSCSVKIVGINGYIGEKIITVTVNKFNLQNAKVIVNDNPFDLQNFEWELVGEHSVRPQNLPLSKIGIVVEENLK